MLVDMYDQHVRATALALLATGATISKASRSTGASRAAIRAWRDGWEPARSECPRCARTSLDAAAYAGLLGYYLGDGCVSRTRGYFSLRISCDPAWPGIVDDVEALIGSVRPGCRVFRVRAPGTVVVHTNWKHWPCLFPQHGPGRKHERAILLAPWQQEIVEREPAAFLRGLFHSDGARVRNWATRVVAGERRRYDYPRWQFVNASDDIRGLCCWALDLVDVGWRRSGARTISVSTRAGVARLDELIGVKR
jgi:hypothetical protein